MIDAVINKVREEANTKNKDKDNANEYDEEVRLTALLKKKKKLSWKDIRPLGKLYGIIIYIRASELLYNEFLNAAGRMIPIDNDTRWNSWHAISMVACELEGFVDAFVKNHRKAIGKYALTPDDWDTLREINIFLKPFEKVTKVTQGDLDSIKKTLVIMDILVKHLEKQKNKHANNTEFQNAILMAWYAFDKYYSLTDQVPAYAVALLLHPLRRKRYININQKKSWVRAVLPQLQSLQEEKYASIEEATSPTLSQPTYEPNEYDLLERDLNVVQIFTDDWESFIKADPTEISTKSTLEWWC